MSSPQDFLKQIDESKLTSLERAKILLGWAAKTEFSSGLSTSELCDYIEQAGHPKQNTSRLESQLSKDRKFVSRVPDTKLWRLRLSAQESFDSTYGNILIGPKRPVETDSILPRSLFFKTRGYIERVVVQINGSYDCGLYDCCAVMCRRLLETLIIEVYETAKLVSSIKDEDGNFFMLAGLLEVFENDKTFSLSRNGRQGLHDFKKLGDLSAHNRRFNARREDIDRIRDGLRISSEELLHIAKLS